MSKFSLGIFILILFHHTVNAESHNLSSLELPTNTDLCVYKTTCGACIQSPECAWCTQINFNEPRCFSKDLSTTYSCYEEFIYNLKNEQTWVTTSRLKNEEMKSMAYVLIDEGNIANHWKLKLRNNEKHVMHLTYFHGTDTKSSYYDDYLEVEIKDTASDPVNVSYWSKCLGDTRIQTNKCDGLKVGEIVQFEIEIFITSCPSDAKDRNQIFQIYPVDVDEALTIDLTMFCSCDCETSGPTFEVNSPICKGSGTLTCGICECNDGFSGRNCEWKLKDLGESSLDAFKCRPDNTTDVECSGRGNCVFGQCHCNPRENPEEMISGQFCECDNFSCDRHNSVLCSGPYHGFCDCGSCKCHEGWEGPACECSSSVYTCIAPNGKICSGRGYCRCGRCECDIKEDVRYSGKYCEKCPTCPVRCEELKACVECQMYKKGPLKDPEDCAKNCTLFDLQSKNKMEFDGERDDCSCEFFDETGCFYKFAFNATVGEIGTITLYESAYKNQQTNDSTSNNCRNTVQEIIKDVNAQFLQLLSNDSMNAGQNNIRDASLLQLIFITLIFVLLF